MDTHLFFSLSLFFFFAFTFFIGTKRKNQKNEKAKKRITTKATKLFQGQSRYSCSL